MFGGLRRCLIVAATAAVSVACASVIGLNDYAIGASDDGGGGGEGGGDSAPLDDSGDVPSTAGLMVSPATVTFGEASCGKSSTASVSVTNPNATSVTVSAHVGAGIFSIRGATGGQVTFDLQAKGSRTLDLDATDPLPGTRTDEVVIETSVGVTRVPVSLTTHGALLSITPEVVDFGPVRKATTPPPLPIVLRNDGDVPVTVTGFNTAAGADFTFPSSVAVPAGAVTPAIIAMTAGAEGTPLSVSGSAMTDIPLCGSTPTLMVKGQRVNQDVLVNPATLSLSSVPCNSLSSTTAKVTITNYGTAQASYQATLPAASKFTLSPASGMVPAASGANPGTTVITIGLALSGAVPGPFTEDLSVALPGAQPPNATVKLSGMVTGVLLQLSQQTLLLANGSSSAVKLKNVGTDLACVAYTSKGSSRLEVEPDDDVPPGAQDDVDVNWKAGFGGGDGRVIIAPRQCAGSIAKWCAPVPDLIVQH